MATDSGPEGPVAAVVRVATATRFTNMSEQSILHFCGAAPQRVLYQSTRVLAALGWARSRGMAVRPTGVAGSCGLGLLHGRRRS